MRKKIIVKGLVQGVGFRYFTNKTANRLGVLGHVKNLPNGNVEIEAQSSEEILNLFIKEMWAGPSNSHVRDIDTISISEKSGESGFRVTF